MGRHIGRRSLLTSSPTHSKTLTFSRRSFRGFCLNRSLNRLLTGNDHSRLRTFLSITPIPRTAVRRTIRCIVQRNTSQIKTLTYVIRVGNTRSNFAFYGRGYDNLTLQFARYIPVSSRIARLQKVVFSPKDLTKQALSHIAFCRYRFRPASVTGSGLSSLLFQRYRFRHVRYSRSRRLANYSFISYQISSLIVLPSNRRAFSPALVRRKLHQTNTRIKTTTGTRIRAVTTCASTQIELLRHFLEIFLQDARISRRMVQLQLNGDSTPDFFRRILPGLLSTKLLRRIA